MIIDSKVEEAISVLFDSGYTAVVLYKDSAVETITKGIWKRISAHFTDLEHSQK